MFELAQVRCFIAVAEELHFGRAAARLHMTQPPVSRQIQLLEQAIGTRLLERTSRLVRLTPAGRVFLGEARRLLRNAESAVLSAQRTASGASGSLAIGFTAAFGYSGLPDLLTRFRARYPDIDVVLYEMISPVQIEALQGGRIDIGLTRPPIDDRLFQSVCVWREPLVLAMPADSALARRRRPQLADLDRQPLVMYSLADARYFYDLLVTIFAEAKIAPLYVQHIGHIHSVLALVRARLGAALVPRAAEHLRFEGVVFKPIDLPLNRYAEIFATWRPENDNPAIAAMLETLHSLGGAETETAGP